MADLAKRFPSDTPIEVITPTTGDATYIKLDFSNLPATSTEGYAINGNTLELWWNGTLVESWTVTPVTPPAGSYMGFGAFTYA